MKNKYTVWYWRNYVDRISIDYRTYTQARSMAEYWESHGYHVVVVEH